jgi:hypothetical protein
MRHQDMRNLEVEIPFPYHPSFSVSLPPVFKDPARIVNIRRLLSRKRRERWRWCARGDAPLGDSTYDHSKFLLYIILAHCCQKGISLTLFL